MATAIKVSKTASPINCCIKTPRTAPTTLRTPISLARFTDRAVVKFIKLIQAMSRIKTATMLNR